MDRHMERRHPVLALSVHRSLLVDEQLGHLLPYLAARWRGLSPSWWQRLDWRRAPFEWLPPPPAVLPLLGGDVERRIEVLSEGVHCGPGLEQKNDNVNISNI